MELSWTFHNLDKTSCLYHLFLGEGHAFAHYTMLGWAYGSPERSTPMLSRWLSIDWCPSGSISHPELETTIPNKSAPKSIRSRFITFHNTVWKNPNPHLNGLNGELNDLLSWGTRLTFVAGIHLGDLDQIHQVAVHGLIALAGDSLHRKRSTAQQLSLRLMHWSVRFNAISRTSSNSSDWTPKDTKSCFPTWASWSPPDWDGPEDFGFLLVVLICFNGVGGIQINIKQSTNLHENSLETQLTRTGRGTCRSKSIITKHTPLPTVERITMMPPNNNLRSTTTIVFIG